MPFDSSARSIFGDYLQVYPFWIFDIAPINTGALPILTPLFGFSSVTAPELTVETTEIREGNWHFPTHVVKQASVGPMTLQQGSTFFNSDFWRWIIAALGGNTSGKGLIPLPIGGPTYRRDFLLIHFFSSNPLISALGGGDKSAVAGSVASLAAVGAAAGLVTGSGSIGATIGLSAGISAGLNALGIGPFEFAARLPAKMWKLEGCIPTRYKAASDFDANSAEISLMELDIAVEMFEEISLSA